MHRIDPRFEQRRTAIGFIGLYLIVATVFSETTVFVDSASVEIFFQEQTAERFNVVKPWYNGTDLYAWLDSPDFDPSPFFCFFVPRTGVQKNLFSAGKRVFIEDFPLSEPVFGTDIYDGDLSFFPNPEFSFMRRCLRFGLFQNSDRLPKTRLSHGRTGDDSENSSVVFTRDIFDASRISFGGNLIRGSEYLPFSHYESQKGYIRLQTHLKPVSIDGYAVHNYEREGHRDSLPSKTLFDLGCLTLRKSFFGVEYGYFFFRAEDSENAVTAKIHSADLFVEFSPLRATDLRLSAGVTVIDTGEEKRIYESRLTFSREIFRLVWLKADLEVKSDSTHGADVSLLFRPALNFSLYGGVSERYNPQPISAPLKEVSCERTSAVFYAGARYLGPKIEFDASGGYVSRLTEWTFVQNNWRESETEPFVEAAFYSAYTPFNDFKIGVFGFRDSTYKACLFSTYSRTLFNGDLEISLSPGTIADKTDSYDYYPFFYLKTRIINLFFDWRIQFDEKDYLIDYGVVWQFTN